MSDMPTTRLSTLDCIRAFAVISVVLYHTAILYPEGNLDEIAMFFRKYGFLGVDVFFPLSGFLITLHLLRWRGRSMLKVFFLRRIFRIVPLYFFAVTLYWIAQTVVGGASETLGNIWINYLFLTGWFLFFEARDAIPYTITWSLSVEEFAYIILGLSAWFFKARIHWVLIGVCVVSICLRWWLIYSGNSGPKEAYFFPLTRLDSIAVGGLAAFMLYRGLALRAAIYLSGLASLLILVIIFSDVVSDGAFPIRSVLLYPLISAGVSILILFAVHMGVNPRNRVALLISNIGFVSYFIYLMHYFIIEGLEILLTTFASHWVAPFWMFSSVCFVLTYLAAIVSSRLFEQPLIRLGRKFETSKNERNQNAVSSRT